MTDTKILLRPDEAAHSLGLSRARVYELMADGSLASIKIGASRRILTEDLHRFVERLRTGNEQARPPARSLSEPDEAA